MDDITTAKGSKKMMMGEHVKTNYRGKHSVSAPYSGSEMKKAMNCNQGGLGIGVAHVRPVKMPNYDNFGQVLSVKHGHSDVKGKI